MPKSTFLLWIGLSKAWLLSAMMVFSVTDVLATDRVLIMTIGQYQGLGSASLPGARKDELNARRLSTLMGYDGDAVTFARDEQLTREGMLAILGAFAASVQAGDRVFIYYSGHGTSFRGQEQCEQALLSFDNKPVAAGDIAQQLDRVRQFASRWLVVMDACHSGGVADRLAVHRGLQVEPEQNLRPKFKPVDECSIPGNSKLWQARLGQRGAELVQGHETFIAAAASDEVALDSDDGGLATLALIDCLSNAHAEPDLDAIRQCSQSKVDARLASSHTYFPHHLQLIGNTSRPQSATATASSYDDWLRRLARLKSQATERWQTSVSLASQQVRIDGEPVAISVQSQREGFVKAYVVDEDSRLLSVIYPRDGEAMALHANVQTKLPVELVASGKPGRGHLLVVVTQTQAQQAVAQQWLLGMPPSDGPDLGAPFSVGSVAFQTVAN